MKNLNERQYTSDYYINKDGRKVHKRELIDKEVEGSDDNYKKVKESTMLGFKDLMEKMNLAKASMGDVIKDFQKSDAPQFAGKSDKKRRQMAIAAKLQADRGVKEELKGKQHKLDKNKNGKLDAHDFKLLRKEELEEDSDFVEIDEEVKTTHEDPLVVVHKGSSLYTHANLSTANSIHGTKVKAADVHKGQVSVGDLKFSISKHHESEMKKDAMKEEVELEEELKGDLHPDAHKVLKHIKPEHHSVYKPYLKKGTYNGSYKDRADVLSAAQKAGHIKEQVELDEANHREFAQAGKMHPDMAKHMVKGREMDFYHSKTGDKISGVVTKNDGKAVHIQANKGGRVGGGEIHKFAVSKNLGGQMHEEVELDEAVKTDNEGRGYHGEHPSDVADKKYSAAHAKVKKIAGEAGHMRDVKKPNVMVKHYLDSVHGRHLAGREDNHEYIKKDFAKFKKSYKPEMHEQYDQEEETMSTEKPLKSFSQFMEQLLEYTPGPGGVTRVSGTYGKAKGAKYGNTDYDSEHMDKKDDEDGVHKTSGPAPVKRGRGRPAGSYGSYKARSAETKAAAAAKAAATKAANKK